MTTLSQIGNGTGYIYVRTDAGDIDSFPNTPENWHRVKVRAARLRTIHVYTKAVEGQTEGSKSFGYSFFVDADAGAVIGTIAVTALEVTQVLGIDDRNSISATSIAAGALVVARERAITIIQMAAEAGLTDDLATITMANAADGDIIILANAVTDQVITVLETDNISIRDAGQPLIRTGEVFALTYSETTNDYREIFRSSGKIKGRDILNVLSGGTTLAVDTDAEFFNLIINGAGATITGNNTVSLPANSRLIVNVLIEKPCYYNGGTVSVEGVVIPQAIMESGLGYGLMAYDTSAAAWYALWMPVSERTVMATGNVDQDWQDFDAISGVVTAAAAASNDLFVRRTNPMNKNSYAGVELFGTVTIAGTITSTPVLLFSGLPDWMLPTDKSPAGFILTVTRGLTYGFVLACVQINSIGEMRVRSVLGNNLQNNDILNFERAFYFSDDSI